MPDLTHETASLLEQYKAACDYPGPLDEAAVNSALGEYCRAVGAPRRIERLRSDWVHTASGDFWACITSVMLTIALKAKNAGAAREPQAARSARDSLVASAARDSLVARATRDALDASAARDAGLARGSLAARATRDALAASRDLARTGDPALGFASWIVHHQAWLWGWELSRLAASYFGAAQLGEQAVIAWTRPVLDAFLHGCWLLFWTDRTLFWVAKPVVHVESSRAGAPRLHCESGPALASDVEDLYFLHGVLVPEIVVRRPDLLNVEDVRQEDNEEVRRIMIERMGWPRYLKETGAVVLHRRVNRVDATKEALMQSEDGSRVLVCSCPSTGRVYGMRVPRGVTTCDQAQSWLAGDAAGRTIGAS